MRALPAGLAASLSSGATTLATCWRLTRTDGVILGFTDHDRPLTFENVLFEPEAGVETAAREESAGLVVDNTAGLGALSSAAIDEADVLSGRWDGARIAIFSVDWTNPDDRLLVFAGTFGEIRRRDAAFEVEVAGLKADLDRPVGRVYQPTCDAVLGDERCGVDLEQPAFSANGAVLTAPDARTVRVSGLDGFENGWFEGGAVSWTSGARAGLVDRIARHTVSSAGVELGLAERAAAPVAPGDAFLASAGCDRRFETCRDKFVNLLNFRGFHRMPGDDYLYSYPRAGAPFDGSAR